ncbi:MAG: S41 family peptidase [Bacteroidota bacterium]
MPKFIFFIPFFLISTTFSQPKDSAFFTQEELKEDLAFLYETLQLSHYNLFADTPKEVFDDAYTQINEKLRDSMSTLEISRLFQPFAALALHGHCNTQLPFSPDYLEYMEAGGKVFPIEIRIEDRNIWIKHLYVDHEGISEGDQILSINGQSKDQILDKIYAYYSGESEYLKNTILDLISFPRSYWLVFEHNDSFQLILQTSDGRKQEIQIAGMTANAFEEAFAELEYPFNTSRELGFYNEVAYLRPGEFMNANGSGNTSEVNSFDNGEFLQFIDSAFSEIHNQKSSSLILDLRGNPGGDNSFSDPMLAYFVDQPFWFCSEFHIRTSPVTKAFWKKNEDTELQELRDNILSHKDGETFEMTFQKYQPRTDSLKFQGKVYVLINRYSYSNTTATAAIIKDYGFATLIGEATADVPSTFGATHQFSLPHTGLNVSYPKAWIIRPNGDKFSKGVQPDHWVKEVYGNETDEVLEWTLRYIRDH